MDCHVSPPTTHEGDRMTQAQSIQRSAATNADVERSIKRLSRVNQQAADETLIRTYQRRLHRHANYILRNNEEAYDVTQEVLVRALRETRRYDNDFKIKAWLYRVTSNLCFNRLRDSKRRRTILDSMDQQSNQPASQSAHVFARQQHHQIAAAIEQLSFDHQAILTLRYYQDLSYAEIATALDIKLGTVMSRLSRARKQLSNVLLSTELIAA